jgi:hypothetical protein
VSPELNNSTCQLNASIFKETVRDAVIQRAGGDFG